MTLLSLPSNREESWRWSDLSALPKFAAAAPSGAVPATLPWIDCESDGPRLLFVDGRLDEGRSRLGPVTIGRVEAASTDHPLARLAGRSGWRLALGSDHAPSGPVQIIHVATGAADHLPGEVALETGAQASIVETFFGDGWTNRFTAFALERGARLMLARRLLLTSGFISLTDSVRIGEGGSFVSTTLAAGGADSRLDGSIHLAGEEGYAEAGG
ncbi:MAG: SufD family Fe-S cluster assembly protein, partial [Alphaproteobacteria bacterium]|nr:SufD family Fe-S cluster assembly protein [Alphaproteobacteria bacterium]